MSQVFEYKGAIYIRPVYRGVILGEAENREAVYFDDVIGQMVEDQVAWEGSDEYEIDLKVVLKKKK